MVIGRFIGSVINLGVAKVIPKGSKIEVAKAVKTAQGITNSPKPKSQVEVKVKQKGEEAEREVKISKVNKSMVSKVVRNVQGISGHGPAVRFTSKDGKVYVNESHLSKIEKASIRYAMKKGKPVYSKIGDDGVLIQVPKQPPSIAAQTTQARKEWKNILKHPESISKERAGSVRFQYFWSTFKPRTKFNQGIKKRVMDGTMTERQAIMTIKKHRKTNEKAKKNADQRANDGKRIKGYSPKEQKRWQENKRIEDELAKHDTKMYRDGNRFSLEDHLGNMTPYPIGDFQNTMQGSKVFAHDSSTFLKFGNLGEIRLPLKIIKRNFGADGQHGEMSFEYLEGLSGGNDTHLISRLLHNQKVEKVKVLEKEHVQMGYGHDFHEEKVADPIGGGMVNIFRIGWEKGIAASRVADKVMKGKGHPPVKHSDFELLQLGTEKGSFVNLVNFPIPQTNKGASARYYKKDRDPMVFGTSIYPKDPNAISAPAKGNDKRIHEHWDLRQRDPLAKAKSMYTDSGTLKPNPWEENKQGGDFYTAGQQSYSRNNAKLWRAIGLGFGGPATLGAATLGSKKDRKNDRKNDRWGYW